MAVPFLNADFPFGSARFAEPEEIARAGLFTREPHSLLVGFIGNQPLWYSDMGGLLSVAGPRSGKGRDLLLYNICQGIHAPTMIVLDIKGGELAAVSCNQTGDRKFCIYWNPRRKNGLPAHRINPLDYINADNPNLISETKTFIHNAIPPSATACSPIPRSMKR